MAAPIIPAGRSVADVIPVELACQNFLVKLDAAPTAVMPMLWLLQGDCQSCDILQYVVEKIYTRPDATASTKTQLIPHIIEFCFVRF